jgi:hypothetical protein
MSKDQESIFSLREVRREIEQPWDIEIALGKRTPQAILRDLYRPTTRFTVAVTEFERYERPRDCGGADLARIHVDFRMDLRVPIVDLLHTNRTMHELYRGLRRLLAQPWQDAPRFGKQTMSFPKSQRYFDM